VSVAYLDTSALVKLYVVEPGTNWIKQLLVPDQTPGVFTSHLTVVEATCAFARRRREGTLSPVQLLRFFVRFRMTFRTGTTSWTWSRWSSKLRSG
jgi:predicted nucleic acid-binding protein